MGRKAHHCLSHSEVIPVPRAQVMVRPGLTGTATHGPCRYTARVLGSSIRLSSSEDSRVLTIYQEDGIWFKTIFYPFEGLRLALKTSIEYLLDYAQEKFFGCSTAELGLRSIQAPKIGSNEYQIAQLRDILARWTLATAQVEMTAARMGLLTRRKRAAQYVE